MGTSGGMVEVRVQECDFDLGREYTILRAQFPGAGAIVTFCGCVRDLAEGAEVRALELEHYPGVTEASVRRIADEAADRWLLAALRVIHRVGYLRPADQIVCVLAASAHRQAAFDASRFVMDGLKTQAVIWKKEQRSDGAYWLEPREDDRAAIRDWCQIS